MTTERKRPKFTPEFKQDAVALVPEQGYSMAKAALAVDTSENNLRRWKKELEQEARKGDQDSAKLRVGLAEIAMHTAVVSWATTITRSSSGRWSIAWSPSSRTLRARGNRPHRDTRIHVDDVSRGPLQPLPASQVRPLDFIAQPVPLPRANLIRFHDLTAPNSRYRARLVRERLGRMGEDGEVQGYLRSARGRTGRMGIDRNVIE